MCRHHFNDAAEKRGVDWNAFKWYIIIYLYMFLFIDNQCGSTKYLVI